MNLLEGWDSLDGFLEHHPQFTKQQLRTLIGQRKTNGITPCLRKMCKKWYINSEMFAKWFNELQQ